MVEFIDQLAFDTSTLTIWNDTNIKAILEGGPCFINQPEQVIFTLYTFIIFVCVCFTNGLFSYCIISDTKYHTPYFGIPDLLLSS